MREFITHFKEICVIFHFRNNTDSVMSWHWNIYRRHPHHDAIRKCSGEGNPLNQDKSGAGVMS